MRYRLKIERLLGALAERTISQNAWASKLGVSRGHLSELVNGKHPYPSQKTREALLAGLGLALLDLFEQESGPTDSEDIAGDFQASLAPRYLLEQLVGSGGMGSVFIARDTRHSRLVAVKVVSREFASSVGSEAFLREGRYMARLEHPNIVTIIDSGEAAGHPYLVMPFVRGGSLRDRMQDLKVFSPVASLPVVEGIARGLAFAHEQRIIHCDIKPENILLVGNHPYITDFGIARAIRANRIEEWRGAVNLWCGTPAYVSPEQASGESLLTAASDVYSLGCVLYEMFSGDAPFEGANTKETIARRFERSPRLGGSIPPAVADVVARAMELDPLQRQQAAGELAADLRNATARSRFVAVRTSVARLRWRIAPVVRSRRSARALTSAPLFETITSDIIDAFRRFRRKPGVALISAAVLSIGIGGVGSVYSTFDAFLNPSPNIPDPTDFRVLQSDSGSFSSRFSPRELENVRQSGEGTVTGATQAVVEIGLPAGVRREYAELITNNYFDVTGNTGIIGRTPTSEEIVQGVPVAVIERGTWESSFDSDTSVIGSLIRIDRNPYTVIGVGPPNHSGSFHNASAAVFIPASAYFEPTWPMLADRPFFRVYANSRAIARGPFAIGGERPGLGSWVRYGEVALDAGSRAGTQQIFWTLTFLASFVMLVACANVANLLVTRAVDSSGETAVRVALGASGARLLRGAGLDATLVATLGGVGGLFLSLWMLSAIPEWLPVSDPPLFSELRLSSSAMLVVGGLVVLTAVLSSAVPALYSSRLSDSANTFLRAGARAAAPRKKTATAMLLLQIAMGTGLLIVAVNLSMALMDLQSDSKGYEERDRYSFAMRIPGTGDPVPVFERLIRELELLPEIRTAAITLSPSYTVGTGLPLRFPGSPDTVGFAARMTVGPNYFGAAGLNFLSGGGFSETFDSTEVRLVVSRNLAERLWGPGDPIGRALQLQGEVVGLVTGVVGDGTLGRGDVMPLLYTDYRASPRSFANVIVHAESDRRSVNQAVAAVVRSIDADIPIPAVIPMEEWFARSWLLERAGAAVARLLAIAALLIMTFGIYGRAASHVSSTIREVAIRKALGSIGSGEAKRVITRGIALSLAGSLVGIGVALGSIRIFRSMVPLLMGDWFAASGFAILILLSVTTVALLVPGLKAARVDPAIMLRSE